MKNLVHYIMNPKETNFIEKPTVQNHRSKLLSKLKELIFEEIRIIIVNEFKTPIIKEEWKRLYINIAGIGSDYERRSGIFTLLSSIVPNMDKYLMSNSDDNWVDRLENVFINSIKKLEEMIEKENEKNCN